MSDTCKPFYVSFAAGCTVVYAKTSHSAAAWARREFGSSSGPYKAKEATKEDIDWVRGFGGRIHNEPAPKQEGVE